MIKPTVHYKGDPVPFGNCMLLQPLDHTNHVPGQNVSNTEVARTSTVISHNKLTGVIETKNTIYVPVEHKGVVPAKQYFTDESASQ